MAGTRLSVLIADLANVASALKQALALDQVDVVEAFTFDQAVQLADRHQPKVYVVGYHFDEMRPYRLVRHVRSMASGAGADILVVRALPLRQPPQEEEELRRAYVSIGADDYLTLYNDVDRSAAFNPLRQAIEKRLARRS